MFENDNVYAYGPVKRWAKNVVGGNVFALNKLVVPVNISSTHWFLCVAHVQVRLQGLKT
jgi:Ulp1 family protease